MSKLTREQISKALNQMGEGWTLDRQMALYWGKRVPLYVVEDEDGGGYSAVTINWRNAHEIKTTPGGQRVSVPTDTYRPLINVSHYVRSNGALACYGLGKDFPVDSAPAKRRMFSQLAKLTHEFTPERIRELVAAEAADRDARLRTA